MQQSHESYLQRFGAGITGTIGVTINTSESQFHMTIENLTPVFHSVESSQFNSIQVEWSQSGRVDWRIENSAGSSRVKLSQGQGQGQLIQHSHSACTRKRKKTMPHNTVENPVIWFSIPTNQTRQCLSLISHKSKSKPNPLHHPGPYSLYNIIWFLVAWTLTWNLGPAWTGLGVWGWLHHGHNHIPWMLNLKSFGSFSLVTSLNAWLLGWTWNLIWIKRLQKTGMYWKSLKKYETRNLICKSPRA